MLVVLAVSLDALGNIGPSVHAAATTRVKSQPLVAVFAVHQHHNSIVRRSKSLDAFIRVDVNAHRARRSSTRWKNHGCLTAAE